MRSRFVLSLLPFFAITLAGQSLVVGQDCLVAPAQDWGGTPCDEMPSMACDNGGCDWAGCDTQGGDSCGCGLCSGKLGECGDCLADGCGFTFGGWIAQGTTINSRHPQNPQAGFGNLPVTFNYRDREYQLNQLYLYAEREADGRCGLGYGGRLDVLFGEDYFFTQAAGLETRPDGSGHWNVGQGGDHSGINGSTRLGIALPQAYGELAYGTVSMKIGHFYTIIGNETVTAPDNFFYSHAYTMQYGEPFTHTGVLAKWGIAERLTLYGGIVNGWDKFDAVTDRGSFLGGFYWTLPNETTNLNISLITGDEDGTATPLVGNRTMYSVILDHAISDDLHLLLQHDLGVQENGHPNGFDDAQWYGLNSYLIYTLNECWKTGFRYEWFSDEDGTRVLDEAGSFQQISLGLNWTPCDCVTIRPETRWDWFDPKDDNAAPGPYDNFNTRSQFTFAADAIITF